MLALGDQMVIGTIQLSADVAAAKMTVGGHGNSFVRGFRLAMTLVYSKSWSQLKLLILRHYLYNDFSRYAQKGALSPT